MFCLTFREFIEALIYPRHGSKGTGMGQRDQAWPRFCLTVREFIKVLIYPRHGFEGLGMADVLFNL